MAAVKDSGKYISLNIAVFAFSRKWHFWTG
jgi:hypothetical protein